MSQPATWNAGIVAATEEQNEVEEGVAEEEAEEEVEEGEEEDEEDGEEDGDNDGEKDSEEEDEEDEQEEDDENKDEGGDAANTDNAAGSSDASGGEGGGGESDLAPTDEEDGPPLDVSAVGSKRPRVSYALTVVSPSLEKQLGSLAKFRTAILKTDRKGVAVTNRSVSNDRANLLRILGWFVEKGLISNPTLAIFGAAKIADAVKSYIESLAHEGRKYSTLAGYVNSSVTCARYICSCRLSKKLVADRTAVDGLAALHVQCLQQARKQAVFDASKPPTSALEWDGIMKARRAAEEALAQYKGASGVKKLRLTRDATLLVWLTTQPPDRVGVARTL